MEKIESFKVNHLNLKKGIYVSRKDTFNGTTVTTFDLRFTEPNKDSPISPKALHTIEHLGATCLRNSSIKDLIVYFGPMGCRTGFYLCVFGDISSADIYNEILKMCEFILRFKGEIPGATIEECGNYKEHNLKSAKKFVKNYYKTIKNERNFEYSC